MIHRPNLYYSKISKRKLKKEYAISSGTGKNRTSQTVSSTLHYFTVLDRQKIKLDKNKMDSKFIKSCQCSLLERSHALLVTKIYKNRTMKISLFNYSMLGYISPITTSLPHIYRRNSCPTHIFKPTHQTGL